MEAHQSSEHVIRDLVTMIRSLILGMWRYRWLAVVAVWIVAVAGWLGVFAMPDVYEANTRVYVDTENAIDDILGGLAAPTDVTSEVAIVVREIVSRPNLEKVALETDLALRAQTEEQKEGLLTSLQDRISVAGNAEGIYSISFEDKDRGKALAVVESLLDAFVTQSLGADRQDAAKAQTFLQEQISEYEERLTEAEDRLANFKRDNVALMPGQGGDYFTRLQAAKEAFQLTVGRLRLATERRGELSRQIEGEEPVFGIMDSSTGNTVLPSNAKIRELEGQLAELRLVYTDKHPRIGQILDTIELLKEQQAEERRVIAENGGPSAPAQSPLDMNPVYQSMRIQLSNVDVEIAALRAERDQQQREIARLQGLVDTVPQVEAELNRLNRDYDVVRTKHQQLLQQLETANIGDDVSRSIDSLQFRIIDPPFVESEPVGPNRPLLISVVLVLATGVGLGLAFLMNLLNPTFIGNRSVSDSLGIPVLASVSLLVTEAQQRAERRRLYVLQATAAVLLAVFVLAVIYADQGASLVQKLTTGVA